MLPALIDDVPVTLSPSQPSEAPLGSPGRIFGVFLCGALAFLELYCTQPLLPLLQRVFHASEASVGLTVSASTFGVAISAALLALFGERLNRKRTIVFSMAGLALVVALTASAHSLTALAFWRLLQGFLTPGVFIITIAYVTEEWPSHQVPRIMSFYVAGTVFGGFVGRIAGGVLAPHYGWQFVFEALAVAGMAGAIATHFLLRPAAHKPFHNKAHWFAPIQSCIGNRRLLATFGIGFCMLFTLVAAFSYITFHLAVAPFHLSTTELSGVFTVYLFGLAATLAVGTVLARIGLRYGMTAAAIVCITGMFITIIPSLWGVGVGLSLASAGVFIAQTCANSFLGRAAPRGTRVAAAGMYICAYYIGGTVGGILPGLFWTELGWTGCVAIICALLAVAGSLGFFGWREPLVHEHR